jgi:hypothetical protein
MSYRRSISLGALVALGFTFVSSDASAARRGGVYRGPNGGAVAWRVPAPYRAYWRFGWGPEGVGYYYNYNAPPCGYSRYPPCY